MLILLHASIEHIWTWSSLQINTTTWEKMAKSKNFPSCIWISYQYKNTASKSNIYKNNKNSTITEKKNAHLCFHSVANPTPVFLWIKTILTEFQKSLSRLIRFFSWFYILLAKIPLLIYQILLQFKNTVLFHLVERKLQSPTIHLRNKPCIENFNSEILFY